MGFKQSQSEILANWMLDHRRFLTPTEIRRLRQNAERERKKAVQAARKTPVKDWFLVMIASESGLRVQEIADLNCGDICTETPQPFLIVREGKGGKPRIVHIREEFARQVEQFLEWKIQHGESTAADAPVFCVAPRRMSKRALQKAYKRSLKKAGLTQVHGVGIHSLRHTYASLLLSASKFNLRLVQKQLGHASIRTTEIYAHLLNPDIERALQRLYT